MPVALAVALIGIRVLMDIATATAGTPGPRGLTGATGAAGPQGMFLLSDTFKDLKYFIILWNRQKLEKQGNANFLYV